MKTRILVAAVGLPLLLVVLLVPTPIPTAVTVALMCIIGAYELMFNTGLAKHIRLLVYACVMAIGICVWSVTGTSHTLGRLFAILFLIALFAEMLAAHTNLKLRTVCVALLAGAVIPYLLSALIRIRCFENGAFYVLVPLILSMVPDSGAYFVGKAMGKHKLAPVISPKKTVEGAIGGLIAGALAMVLYGLILQLFFKFSVNYFFAVCFGLIGSAVSVFGDLSFSVIKRQTKIKDFGNLLPGHGGILDRFDSTSFVAPVTEVLLLLIPFAVK